MALTRDELADRLEEVIHGIHYPSAPAIERQDVATVVEAAALLRQSCKGCQHYREATTESSLCGVRGRLYPVPADGSGHCWQWKEKV